MKRKVELLTLALSMFALAAPLAAHARNCELPHEQLEMRCGGDRPNSWTFETDESAVSAVKKSRSLADIRNELRARNNAYEALVQKATDDYRAYLASRRQ